MRTVTIEYNETGFTVRDNDDQYVNVEIEGDKALVVSMLHGDETVVFGSCHRQDAEAEALALMGVGTTYA